MHRLPSTEWSVWTASRGISNPGLPTRRFSPLNRSRADGLPLLTLSIADLFSRIRLERVTTRIHGHLRSPTDGLCCASKYTCLRARRKTYGISLQSASVQARHESGEPTEPVHQAPTRPTRRNPFADTLTCGTWEAIALKH